MVKNGSQKPKAKAKSEGVARAPEVEPREPEPVAAPEPRATGVEPGRTGGADRDVIAVLLALLEHPRGERRQAAAIVLTELAPEGEAVLDALRKATQRADDSSLRRWAVEAIGAIAPKSIVRDLQPLIKDPERVVREAVSRVLSSGRGVKAADIARMIDEGDDKERFAAIAVLGAMGGREGRKKILTQLAGATSRISGAVIDALRSQLLAAEGAEARAAIDDLGVLLDEQLLVEDPDYAIAVVQLFSYVGDEASASALLTLALAPVQPEVSAAALEAIRKVIKTRKPEQRLYKALLEIVERPKLAPQVLGAALETLKGFDVPIALEPRVRALLGSESVMARRWAIEALGELDAAPAAKALAKVVDTGDPADREASLEAARRTTHGRQELARLLGRTHDEARARQIAVALKSLGESLEQATRQILEDSVVEARPETAEIIVEVLKHVGGKSAGKVQDSLLDKAVRLKKKGQFQEAIAILESICHGREVDPEARFQLGVCELKASKKVISRGPSTDRSVATFNTLSRARDFPMMDRLKKEKLLEPEELYYLGFSLAEGSDAEQAIGGDILSFLAEEASDTKLGKMAKNKLITMGWED